MVPEHLFALTGVGHLHLLGPLANPVEEELGAYPMCVIQGRSANPILAYDKGNYRYLGAPLSGHKPGGLPGVVFIVDLPNFKTFRLLRKKAVTFSSLEAL